MFDSLDANKNGSIEAEDFTKNINGEYLRQLWNHIRDSFDIDGDGAVDFDVFLTYFVIIAVYGEVTTEYSALCERLERFKTSFLKRFLAELQRVDTELEPYHNISNIESLLKDTGKKAVSYSISPNGLKGPIPRYEALLNYFKKKLLTFTLICLTWAFVYSDSSPEI